MIHMMDKARRLMEMGLCDRCIGRFFSDRGHGLSNPERGRALRTVAAMQDGKTPGFLKSCELCGDLFSNMEKKAELVVGELEGTEFDTFLIGSKIDRDTLEKESAIREELELSGESIKAEFNRELGKVLEKVSGRKFSREMPDIEILYDTRFDDIKVQINSVFIYGRYRKLIRGIPQTRWPCRYCGGKGCEHCNWTGKMYPESVEEIIAHEFMEESRAKEHALHGMGREDIDARMLGNGRPFVLELKSPKMRKFDLEEMERRVNEFGRGKVEVLGLRYSSKAEVRKIKGSRAEKTYMVWVMMENEVEEEKLKNALRMLETEIEQRTPTRVSHRRADLVRRRRVIYARLIEKSGAEASIEVKGEAGLYIKELMHGDNGRTSPSLAQVLGTPCRVLELDVIKIEEKEEQTW